MPRPIQLVLLAAAVVLAAGCADDPSQDVPQAKVKDASAAGAAPAIAGGDELPLAEGSTLGFTGSKVTGKHDGVFEKFTGTITLVDGDPTRSRIRVEVDIASLSSDGGNNARLDKHLRSADFFDAENHPTGTFVSTRIAPAAAAGAFDVTGDLTLRGVTKSIEFPATIEVTGNEVRARAEFSIDRKAFGIAYAGKPDDLIRDGVVVRFDVKAARPER